MGHKSDQRADRMRREWVVILPPWQIGKLKRELVADLALH